MWEPHLVTIHLNQHVPSFVDGPTPKHASIETAEDLENVEWIRSWKHAPPHVFHQFSFSPMFPGADRGHLMAEYDDGDHFWVVAYCDHRIPGLPEWVESEHARRRREAWNRGDMEECDRLDQELRSRQP